MNRQEALFVLEIDEGAGREEIDTACTRLRDACGEQIASAPSQALRSMYEDELAQVEVAYAFLTSIESEATLRGGPLSGVEALYLLGLPVALLDDKTALAEEVSVLLREAQSKVDAAPSPSIAQRFVEDLARLREAADAATRDAEQRHQALIRAREEAERQAREEAEHRAREEAERQTREEAEHRAREEAERRAREEAERRAHEEAERRAHEEAERRAHEEAERRAHEEAERRAREEAERWVAEVEDEDQDQRQVEAAYASSTASPAKEGSSESVGVSTLEAQDESPRHAGSRPHFEDSDEDSTGSWGPGAGAIASESDPTESQGEAFRRFVDSAVSFESDSGRDDAQPSHPPRTNAGLPAQNPVPRFAWLAGVVALVLVLALLGGWWASSRLSSSRIEVDRAAASEQRALDDAQAMVRLAEARARTHVGIAALEERKRQAELAVLSLQREALESVGEGESASITRAVERQRAIVAQVDFVSAVLAGEASRLNLDLDGLQRRDADSPITGTLRSASASLEAAGAWKRIADLQDVAEGLAPQWIGHLSEIAELSDLEDQWRGALTAQEADGSADDNGVSNPDRAPEIAGALVEVESEVLVFADRIRALREATEHVETTLLSARIADGATALPRLRSQVESLRSELTEAGLADGADGLVVSRLMEQAAAALAQDRLMFPADSSAFHYFSQVLELDPVQPEALEGLRRVGVRYVVLAEDLVAKGDVERGRQMLDRARTLEVSSERLSRVEKLIGEHAKAAAQQSLVELAERAGAAIGEEELDIAADLVAELAAHDVGAAAPLQAKLSRELMRPGRRFTDALDESARGPEMIVISPGRFQMGEESMARRLSFGVLGASSGPVRPVTIDKPFAVARTETTVAQFRTFVEATGYRPASEVKGGGLRTLASQEVRVAGLGWSSHPNEGTPVVQVSHADATAYAEWLSERSGHRYRLPSEAEFEYLLRSGGSTRYPWGDDAPSGVVGNLFGALDDVDPDWEANRSRISGRIAGYRDGYFGVAPAGSFPANGLGLHDLSGNVAEWVEDCMNPDHRDAPLDGAARRTGDCRQRVVRGGAWNTELRGLRSAARNSRPSEYFSDTVGFRVVRELKGD